MNCRKALSYISAYYDDELSYSTKDELLKHVENCTKCQREMLLQEQVRAGVKSFAAEELADDFNDRLFARIYSAPRTEATRVSNVPTVLSFRLKSIAPVFAAASVIVIAAFLALSQFAFIGNSGGDNYADNQKSGLINVSGDIPLVTPAHDYYPISAGDMSLSAARLESLQILASLKNNKMLMDRMRLDAANRFGGFQNRNNDLNQAVEERYNTSRKYIYPVVRNAGADTNPY
jgi:hypothetical protein